MSDEIKDNVSAKITEQKKQSFIKDDLLGRDEWRSSKLGYLSGLSSVGKVGASVATNIAQSFGRLSMLFKFLRSSEDVPELPPVQDQEYDGNVRFRQAVALHRRSKSHLKTAQSNTKRSFYLYVAIAILGVLYGLGNVVVMGNTGVLTIMLHLTSIIVFGALAFKSSYVNWMIRNETLDSPMKFINSSDIWPK